MILRYAGHKPAISHTGVNFTVGKEDKYIYAHPAAVLLQNLKNAPVESRVEVVGHDDLTDSKIVDLLSLLRPNLKKEHAEHIESYKEHLKHEDQEVDGHKWLNDMEKEIWKNNLHCMESYRIQRATNKFIYEEIIQTIIEMIEAKKIEHIALPFSIENLHVAESIEAMLRIITATYSAKVWVPQDNKPSHIEIQIEHIDISLLRS